MAAVVLATVGAGLLAGAEPAHPAVPPAGAPESVFRWQPFLGPFHSLILHYPIGFVSIAVAMELYTRRWRTLEIHRAIRMVIWLSLVTGLLAAGLGIIRAQDGGYDPTAVSLHRWFGMAVPVVTFLTLIAQGRVPSTGVSTGYRRACYLVLLWLTLGSLVVAGHYGGNLTHGSRYLVQHAPEFVKDILEPEADPESGASTSTQGGGNSEGIPADIRLIFDARCVTCHGLEKNKGKFRLDSLAGVLTPGASGKPSIVPGRPLESYLVQLILLPTSHDDVMPPAGRERLTPEEILRVIHWIQAGQFGTTVPPAPGVGKPK